MMRVCIATGGTGGHIYPALALCSAMQNKHPGMEFLFVGSTNRLEATEIPKAGYPYFAISSSSGNGKLSKKVSSLINLMKGYRQCYDKFKQFKPDIVIGFGNYISVAPILAAKRLRIKTMIHEQNSIAGKANLFLAPFVDACVGSYEQNKQQFPLNKTKILGNPRASEASLIKKNSTFMKQHKLDETMLTVFMVMGSLGSSSVNEQLKQVCLQHDSKEYQLVCATGRKGYDNFIRNASFPSHVHVVPYIDGLQMMACSDVLVSRAGATTIAELCEVAISSILVPSPYVPLNHQWHNAMALSSIGAAMLLEEKECTSKVLKEKIEQLIRDKALRETMSQKAKSLSKATASDEMIVWIEQLIGENNGIFNQ